MQCAYCLFTGHGVEEMATCSAKCSVAAHSECFEKRTSTHVFRKKHASRGNHECELCPIKSCNARLKIKNKRQSPQYDRFLPGKRQTNNAEEIDMKETMCGYPMKNGRLCTRNIVCDGACKLHAHDAAVKKKMVFLLQQDTICQLCDDDGVEDFKVDTRGTIPEVKEASVQTYISEDTTTKMKEENRRLRDIISALQARESDAEIKHASEISSTVTDVRRKTLADVANIIERMRIQ